jgi:hypothetical protein
MGKILSNFTRSFLYQYLLVTIFVVLAGSFMPAASLAQQPIQDEFATLSPSELYVRAVQLEAQGDTETALKYYKYLMETYPNHDLAVKAADRFTILSTSMPPPPATPVPEPTPTLPPPKTNSTIN